MWRCGYLHVKSPKVLHQVDGITCSLNSRWKLAGYTALLISGWHWTHAQTHLHIQSFWVMGTRRRTHTVFILYGFLFECVLLTRLLMASPFPGQGSAIRPYPGHARRAGSTRKNEVSRRLCPPNGLPFFQTSARNWKSRRLLRNMKCDS